MTSIALRKPTEYRAQELPIPLLAPKLVIAPYFGVFQRYCMMHLLDCRGAHPQALYIVRSQQLRDYDELRSRIIILGYANTPYGKDMQEYVEARLQIERARATRAARDRT